MCVAKALMRHGAGRLRHPPPAARAHVALVAENPEDFAKAGDGVGAGDGSGRPEASSVWGRSFLTWGEERRKLFAP